jgi:hypothetical protein
MDIQDIKLQTRDLSAKLETWGQQLIDGSITLSDVRRDFEERYQPQALELTDAMTGVVPTGTPGIRVEFSNGINRYVTFSDRPYIAQKLPNNETANADITAGVQFKTTASILRKLATSLPEPVEA